MWYSVILLVQSQTTGHYLSQAVQVTTWLKKYKTALMFNKICHIQLGFQDGNQLGIQSIL